MMDGCYPAPHPVDALDWLRSKGWYWQMATHPDEGGVRVNWWATEGLTAGHGNLRWVEADGAAELVAAICGRLLEDA